MQTSGNVIRQATELVIEHLKKGQHYVNMCIKPLDSDDWHLEFTDILKMNREDAKKLLARASESEESAKALMAEIEKVAEGFFYKKIYRSPNWSYAYRLLKQFSINVLYPQKEIAQKRIELIDDYSQSNS